MTIPVLCVLGSFLVGGIPFALLLGKLRGIDIRTAGSGNIGATNLTRLAGRRWGAAAFLLDFLKGLLPVVAAGYWLPLDPAHRRLTAIGCGLAAILGHIFPIYLRFRGGKGVSTSFGVMAGLLPVPAAAAGAVWGAVYLARRMVSLASIAAAAAFPPAVLACFLTISRGWEWRDFIAFESLALGAAALILIRHRGNIARLLAGKEHRF